MRMRTRCSGASFARCSRCRTSYQRWVNTDVLWVSSLRVNTDFVWVTRTQTLFHPKPPDASSPCLLAPSCPLSLRLIYLCVFLQLFLGMPDMVTCRVVSWTFVLLRTISTSAYVHPILSIPKRDVTSFHTAHQVFRHRPSRSFVYRHGLSSLSPWHLCACLDPTASWFRLWCLRLPPPQLLGLLQDTGK
jgi:hypothetical protein